MKKLICIEDDPVTQMMIRKALGENFVLTLTSTLDETITRLATDKFDLALVDLSLPDGNGQHLCQYIRNRSDLSNLPIIVVSAESRPEQKIQMLNIGADDYVTKPFMGGELLARVNARLRPKPSEELKDQFEFAGYRADFKKNRVFAPGGPAINLTRLEHLILFYLIQNRESVLSRRQILDHVWPHAFEVSDRVVDTHVSRLRRKLGPLGDAIRSIHGVGYLFTTSPS